MKIKKAEFIDGVYSWDNPITKEQWILILQDKTLISEASKSTLYKFYLEAGHRSTCQKLGEKHGIKSNVIHKNISALGKAAQSKLNRFEVIGSDKQPTHWIIPMYGKLKKRALEWVIRPELIAAMEELYVEGNPSQEKTINEASIVQKRIKTIRQTNVEKTKTNFSVEKYVDLLKTSKNLVLTGIIGTGKTYLARKIAKKMQAEVRIVRFHDAYSYSDFIGGVRPATLWDNNENKESLYDGTFTAFCKEALLNLIDSQKTKEELEEDRSIYQTMIVFVKIIGNKIFEDGEYPLDGDNNFKGIAITDLNQASLTVTSKAGVSTTIPWVDMIPKYKIYKKHKNLNWSLIEIENTLKIYQHHQVLFLFLKAFDRFQEDNLVKVKADVVKRKDFVFIIDEMNKANVSTVFGEVFPTIQPTNRGPNGKTATRYAYFTPKYDLFYNGFYVPENVYIIGTINDVDTDNKIIDFNTISKFTWKKIEAVDRIAMWDEVIPEYKEKAYNLMTIINNKIDSIPGLDQRYHIGPTYFFKLKNYKGDFGAFWDNYLEGILTRYLINQPNHARIIEQLKEACENGRKLIPV